MSLEQAILDRLEKRNAQIAQLQSTVHALERAADSQREHAMMERGRLLEENKQLAAQVADRYQIVTDLHDLYNQRISARDDSLTAAERLCKSLNDEITKRDHELRAHEKELAEQREEIRKLRAEVPLESTREGLKNATVKIAEVTAQLGSAKGEAEEWLKQCNAARRQRDEVRDLCAELQSKYESLLAKITDLGSYAMTLGRKEGEPLEMFMERQALRLAALESKAGPSIETLSAELSVRYSEIAELHKWALVLIENPSFAKNAPEHTRNYRDIVERINSRPQLDLTATLPTVDWQGVARNCGDELAKLKAMLGPLEKMYEQIKGISRENGIITSRFKEVLTAVDEATKALSRLTA